MISTQLFNIWLVLKIHRKYVLTLIWFKIIFKKYYFFHNIINMAET